jgi:hypothetical protein
MADLRPRDNANSRDVLETIDADRLEILRVLAGFTTTDDTQALAESSLRLRKLMEGEQDVVFPFISALSDEADDLVDEAEDQHADIEDALVDLESGITTPKIATLKTAVNTHFDDARGELFKVARRGLTPNQKQELAIRYNASKDNSEVV